MDEYRRHRSLCAHSDSCSATGSLAFPASPHRPRRAWHPRIFQPGSIYPPVGISPARARRSPPRGSVATSAASGHGPGIVFRYPSYWPLARATGFMPKPTPTLSLATRLAPPALGLASESDSRDPPGNLDQARVLCGAILPELSALAELFRISLAVYRSAFVVPQGAMQ